MLVDAEKKAVVLLSGGLDSATTLAIARADGYVCYTLSFDYGQRHRIEITAAERIARALGSRDHRLVRLDLAWMGGSALTDPTLAVPDRPSVGMPITYVPARNTVFLAVALGWSEVQGAQDIFIGANAVDYSGYPDCRPEYMEAFECLANLATRAGVEGRRLRVHTPLMQLRKHEIIRRGIALGVNYALTTSCYAPDADGRACGVCDSCRLRAAGFRDAGVPDPTLYVSAGRRTSCADV
jgi:7-cyano-7-deazaguanine synthase